MTLDPFGTRLTEAMRRTGTPLCMGIDPHAAMIPPLFGDASVAGSPAVNAIIQRLQREDLVETRPYRSIFLTDKGKALAEASQARHQIVRDFLVTIGVPASIAEEDAEGVEHHVSEETLRVFADITKRGTV